MDLALLIANLLAAGCGVAIQFAYEQYLDYLDAQGQPGPTPFAKRWIMIGLNVVVPSALYVAWCILSKTPFDVVQDLGYVGLAFMTGQGTHSRKLPKTVTP